MTAICPQTNREVERRNRTIVERLWHYVSGHQTSWNQFVKHLTYGYNAHVHQEIAQPYQARFCLVSHLVQQLQTLPALYQRTSRSFHSSKDYRIDLCARWTFYQNKGKKKSWLSSHATRVTLTELSDTQLNSTQNNACLLTGSWSKSPKSARMKKALLTKSISKALNPLNVIFKTLDTVRVEKKGTHNTVHIDRLTFAP